MTNNKKQHSSTPITIVLVMTKSEKKTKKILFNDNEKSKKINT